MNSQLRHVRKHIYPRAELLARGTAGPPRASSITLGVVLVMAAVALVAKAIAYLFTAT